ncbi:hypothetical protein [Ferrimonas marina]|uniref:hypothetical protein n=1 Tax=Ferrimonas marina TaxID=299255 RepID=UPI0011613B82|nr:hypothetical protein [Ferrimonas marina]
MSEKGKSSNALRSVMEEADARSNKLAERSAQTGGALFGDLAPVRRGVDSYRSLANLMLALAVVTGLSSIVTTCSVLTQREGGAYTSSLDGDVQVAETFDEEQAARLVQQRRRQQSQGTDQQPTSE